MSPNLVLASNSPRRKHLLALLGWPFQVLPVEIDEKPLDDEDPREYVLRLAESKARSAAQEVSADALVLAADTTVVEAGEILGKPSGPDQAVEMLRRLRGHAHQVYTSIVLVRREDGLYWADVAATEVPMREYSDQEIADYVACGDPLDKAGAYAIQHPGFKPVASLDGCFANVMGLPLCHLARGLRKSRFDVPEHLPQACQSLLAYRCPVYGQILSE